MYLSTFCEVFLDWRVSSGALRMRYRRLGQIGQARQEVRLAMVAPVVFGLTRTFPVRLFLAKGKIHESTFRLHTISQRNCLDSGTSPFPFSFFGWFSHHLFFPIYYVLRHRILDLLSSPPLPSKFQPSYCVFVPTPIRPEMTIPTPSSCLSLLRSLLSIRQARL